jgi:hypothetical protein
MPKDDRFYLNDTAVVERTLFDEDGVTPLPATSYSYTMKKPDGTVVSGGPTTINDADVRFTTTNTNLPGFYQGAIQFTLGNGEIHSETFGFEILDPLQTTTDSTTPEEAAIDLAWMKFEDMFDSDPGGPYLRDRTKNMVSRDKIARFVTDAIYTINTTYVPTTTYDETSFPYDPHMPLLSQSLVVNFIKHLMRSYVEQPNPVGGGQFGYFDRRDYLNRWQSLFTIENTQLLLWLDLFKKDQMGFGSTSILVGGYATWYGRYPRYMRGRYPYIYRF